MSGGVEIRPGRTPLSDWQAIYRGAQVTLDPFARPDVEIGAAALAEILAAGPPPPVKTGAPSLAEMMEAEGDGLPQSLVRLFVALKLGSLAQGLTGARWTVICGIADFLRAGLLPVVPADDASDRLALAHLFAALTGTGEAMAKTKRRPAAKALKTAKLSPLNLNPQERVALLSGTELSTAAALAGLFEAERVFRSALVAAALSAAALQQPGAPPRVPRLYRQPGQLEAAAALRALAGPDETGETEGEPEAAEAIGSAAAEMGACLDLLRQAGTTLERAANAVTESRLVLWHKGELVAGLEDRSSAERGADVVALALGALGDLSRARTTALIHSAGEAPGDGADENSAEASANGFAARVREQADAPPGMRRLLPMAGTAALVVAIEVLTAARLCETKERRIGDGLARVLDMVREAAPNFAAAGASAAGDLAAIAERVSSGALVDAAGMPLPGLAPQPQRSPRAKRG